MTAVNPPPSMPRDSESAKWVRQLRATEGEHAVAVTRLHEMLLRVARSELQRRSPRVEIAGPEIDDLAHQAAADALVAVVRKIDQFRGESRFTTWAYRFVVLEVSTKLGRHFWRSGSVRLDDEEWELLPARFGFDPRRQAEWRDLIHALRRAIDEELSPRQRRVFVAIVLHEVPLDALVVELATTRNAIYKSLFDARRKLRSALAANGYMDPDPRYVP